jgi:hypothetical protein
MQQPEPHCTGADASHVPVGVTGATWQWLPEQVEPAGQQPSRQRTGFSFGQTSMPVGAEQPVLVHVAPAGQQPVPHATGKSLGQLPGTIASAEPRLLACALVAPWFSSAYLRCKTELDDEPLPELLLPLDPALPDLLPLPPQVT